MTRPADIFLRLRQRPALALASLVLAIAVVGALFLVERYSAARKQAAVAKDELSTFRTLEEGYIREKAGIEEALRKARSKADQQAVAVIERAADAVGARPSIAFIRQAGEEERLGYAVAKIDVRLERVDLNRIVNLLYHLERGGALIVTKEFSMRTRFDEPELYDVDLKLTHVRRKPDA